MRTPLPAMKRLVAEMVAVASPASARVSRQFVEPYVVDFLGIWCVIGHGEMYGIVAVLKGNEAVDCLP